MFLCPLHLQQSQTVMAWFEKVKYPPPYAEQCLNGKQRWEVALTSHLNEFVSNEMFAPE